MTRNYDLTNQIVVTPRQLGHRQAQVTRRTNRASKQTRTLKTQKNDSSTITTTKTRRANFEWKVYSLCVWMGRVTEMVGQNRREAPESIEAQSKRSGGRFPDAGLS